MKSPENIDKILCDSEAFTLGLLLPQSKYAVWRYTEKSSFVKCLMIEIHNRGRNKIALKYEWENSSEYDGNPFDFQPSFSNTVLKPELWNEIQNAYSELSITIPKILDISGRDGSTFSLMFGDNQQMVLFKWWSYYDDRLIPLVMLTSFWKEKLLGLDWTTDPL
ncbi:MAG: hypothetical protein ABIH86_02735 [Planctomycetota bacterium]